ncbi:PAS domain S-box protein [uncultured Desulfobacter sp.]|uniref:hybrid sensor histidine kinase/response regulator n=1 Tax=uncultured Desulfobacter sp. TaxID=240139 RepID=UPI0029F4A213|nr:PAS domain S-box protein [uncultured Desulfobacter sp.]
MDKKPTYEDLEKRVRELEGLLFMQKQAKARPLNREMFLRTLIETIPDLVWLKNPDGVYLACNRKFERFFNTKEKDIVGKTDYDFMCKQEADFFRKHDKAAIASGKPVKNEEEVIYRNDGHKELLETIKTPMFDTQNQLIGVLGVARDITERKRIERELRMNEARLQLTLKVANIGIWDWDIANDIWYASPIYYTMLGYKPIFGRSDREIWIKRIHPEDREMVRNKINSILNFKTNEYSYEARMKHADGSFRWHYVTGYVLERDKDDKPVHLIGLRIDITERKKAEAEKEKLQAQLIQAQKMEAVGRLAGGVAHDFNNMLGVIMGQAELMLFQMDPALRYFSGLQEIRKAAESSANLTRQLLAFARKQTISPKVLNLNTVVESMIKMLQRIIGEDIHLVWSPGKKPWNVMMDAGQIDQILINLCVNARDSISGVGKIIIETKNCILDADYCIDHTGFIPGDYTMLMVSDSGCGMGPDILNNIFEPFFTTKEKGTGLGLAMIYGIVKQNRGFINVYSEPGHGSTFKIYLPRHQTQTGTKPQTDRPEPIETGSETILVVEDNIDILEISRAMLEQQGYIVLTAASPVEALEVVKTYDGSIDLLITDVIMPVMNGRELAKQLKSSRPDLKQLYMSGYTADIIAHHGVLEDGIHFIQKPFSIRELASKVRQVIEGR